MKLSYCVCIGIKHVVTPCVGVWIETGFTAIRTIEGDKVTPCVGVWIETAWIKLDKIDNYVTPCVGVWIETEVNRR